MRILLERLADNAQWGRAAIATATASASVAGMPVQATPSDTDSNDTSQAESLPVEKISKKLH